MDFYNQKGNDGNINQLLYANNDDPNNDTENVSFHCKVTNCSKISSGVSTQLECHKAKYWQDLQIKIRCTTITVSKLMQGATSEDKRAIEDAVS